VAYGAGVYRRRIELTAEDGRVVGELHDDFHHFRVVLTHDGTHILTAEGEAVRFPWSSCGRSPDALAAVVGAPLTDRVSGLGEHADIRANCTHLFDTAALGVAHAAAGRAHRVYEVAVPDRDAEWITRPTLDRDGERLLEWTVDRREILDPEPYAGVSLRQGFVEWADRTLDRETAEAAIVLRRASMISFGRAQDLDAHETAGELGDIMSGTCFTFTPGVMETSIRMKGSTREFPDAAPPTAAGSGSSG